ncbi:hypothetical protein R1sor_001776 [Riccia sorocarpa]|uniref:Uncharacterized protein n=1 Tax=Riccia sorocarpa TaxID=122646 RepID=A0ABD3H0W4_9MARC
MDSEEDRSGSEDGETDIDENVMEEVGADGSEVQRNEERVIWDFTLVEDSQAPGESMNTNHSSEGPAIDTNIGVGSEGPQVDENVGVGNQDPAVDTNCDVGRQELTTRIYSKNIHESRKKTARKNEPDFASYSATLSLHDADGTVHCNDMITSSWSLASRTLAKHETTESLRARLLDTALCRERRSARRNARWAAPKFELGTTGD